MGPLDRNNGGMERMQTLTPDICVIGGGPGGRSIALAAAGLGVPVVLVDRGALDGDGLDRERARGQALLAAARQAEAVRRAPAFGIGTDGPRVDFAAVADHDR